MNANTSLRNEVLALCRELIQKPSVTPDDGGCQPLIRQRLAEFGFTARELPFGDVSNIWLRLGEQPPLLAFAGHTDVVPTGPEDTWSCNPFAAEERGDMLYGRGAADMKGSLAAWIVAVESWLRDGNTPAGSLGLLLTSDEEGPAQDGTRKVVEWLEQNNQHMDWCIVGEPSSRNTLGDTVRIGRRGSLGARVKIHGRQGHVAYPAKAENPIHRLAPALSQLAAEEWDQGNDHFPPTGFQVSNFNAGTGADNVIPGEADFLCNFRFCTESTAESLKARFCAILDAHDLRYDVSWRLSGEPFLTQQGELVEATQDAIQTETGTTPKLDTGGGTSDARFIAPTGTQVLELGPINATIHQTDEHVSIADLGRLASVYRHIIQALQGAGKTP